MLRTILTTAVFIVFGGTVIAAGPVHVKAYTRKDGTHVQAHTRSAPGSGPVVYPRMSAPPIMPRTEARTEARSLARGIEEEPRPKPKVEKPRPSTRHQIKNAIIDVRSASIARPRFVNATKSKFASRKYLVIELAVSLDDPAKPVKFRTFAGPKVKLTDERGRTIKHVETDGEGLWPDGRNVDDRDLSHAKQGDPLVFELPEEEAGDLTLEVFWDYLGESPAVMVIPATMVK